MEKLDNIHKFLSSTLVHVGKYVEDNETGEIFEVLKCGYTIVDDRLYYAITGKLIEKKIILSNNNDLKRELNNNDMLSKL